MININLENNSEKIKNNDRINLLSTKHIDVSKTDDEFYEKSNYSSYNDH